MAFHRWSLAATRIPNGAVLGSRRTRVWGLLLPAWSEEYFREINSRCGGLLEVDPRSINRELISAVRMKVGAKNLLDIPRMLELRFNREVFVLLVEVEAVLGASTVIEDLSGGETRQFTLGSGWPSSNGSPEQVVPIPRQPLDEAPFPRAIGFNYQNPNRNPNLIPIQQGGMDGPSNMIRPDNNKGANGRTQGRVSGPDQLKPTRGNITNNPKPTTNNGAIGRVQGRVSRHVPSNPITKWEWRPKHCRPLSPEGRSLIAIAGPMSVEVAVPSNVVRRLYRDLIDEVFETT